MLRCGRSRVTGWEISQKCDRVSRAIESVKVILTSRELGDTSGFFKVILKNKPDLPFTIECTSEMDNGPARMQLKAFRYYERGE